MVNFELDKLSEILDSLKNIPNIKEVRELRKRLQKEQKRITKPAAPKITIPKVDANVKRSKGQDVQIPDAVWQNPSP